MLKHNRHIETNNKTRKRLIKRKRLTIEILFATLQRSANRKTIALFLRFYLFATTQKHLIFFALFLPLFCAPPLPLSKQTAMPLLFH